MKSISVPFLHPDWRAFSRCPQAIAIVAFAIDPPVLTTFNWTFDRSFDRTFDLWKRLNQSCLFVSHFISFSFSAILGQFSAIFWWLSSRFRSVSDRFRPFCMVLTPFFSFFRRRRCRKVIFVTKFRRSSPSSGGSPPVVVLGCFLEKQIDSFCEVTLLQGSDKT